MLYPKARIATDREYQPKPEELKFFRFEIPNI